LKIEVSDQEKVIKWIKRGTGFLIYQGAPGCGKTHFCNAMENDARKFGNFHYMRHWKEYTFFERVRNSIERGVDFNFEVTYLMDDDLIIYDDLGSIGIKEWRNEVLLTFIDIRYQSKKPTVITSNLTEKEIKEKLGFRIHSRLFSKESIVLNFGENDLRQQGY
jgi:DNA replication protein DnaC